MTTLLAVGTAVVAVALAVPGSRPVAGGTVSAGDPPSRRGWRLAAAGAGVGGAAATLLLDGVRLALALVLLGAVAGALHLRQRERRRQEAARTRDSVVEVGEALAGELRAGRPVVTALVRAAETWAPFASVARAAALDADVPAALRRLGARPGAEGLHDLAAGWEVASRTGSGVAGVLTEVVAGGRGAHEDLRTVGTELASARATARLMLLLPVVTLGLAAGTGTAAWRSLLSEPLGVACLAAGVALALGGLLWIDRIADSVVRR